MAKLVNIEEWAREWQTAVTLFCGAFEVRCSEAVEHGKFNYTYWYIPLGAREKMRFTLYWNPSKGGLAVYWGSGQKDGMDQKFYAPDLQAWCFREVWKYNDEEGQGCESI